MSGNPASPGIDNGASGGGPFQRIPSESSLVRNNPEPTKKTPNKSWERSQSALNLENKTKDTIYVTQTSNEYTSGDAAASGNGGKVSEQSTVYWDLSKVDDGQAGQAGGKFKISLQTIHQKQEMSSTKSTSSPNVSIQARVVRRMSSESSGGGRTFEYSLPAPRSPTEDGPAPPPTTTSCIFCHKQLL